MAGNRNNNSAYKNGIIRENDPKNGRSRVEFIDEDGTTSYWMRWNSPFTGKSKFYNQPDIGSQVNCLVDHNGEDGVIIGASYSKADPPPTQNGKQMKAAMEGGLDYIYDKVAGTLWLKLPNTITLQCGSSTIEIQQGQIVLKAPYIQMIKG
jgi:phage baseplate assembly protein V